VKKSTIIQYAGGIALAGAGLYLFLRDVSLHELWNNLVATPPLVVASGIVLSILTIWLRSLRWNLILPASPAASRKDLFGMVMIAFMVNNFLPARIGEAVRVVLLWKRNRFTIAESVGSVLIERLMDSFIFLSLFLVPVLLMPQFRSMLPYAIPLTACAGVAFACLLFYAMFPVPARSIGRKILRIFPERLRTKASGIGKELVSNLDWVFSPGKAIVVGILSFVIIACQVGLLMVLAGPGFPVLAGMFCTAMAAFGAAIPLSPGYVGTLHAALKMGLSQFGVETTRATAIATMFHAMGYVTVSVIGLYYYFKLGVSFRDVGRAKETLKKEIK
jgi:hypothetical protein